MEITIQYINAVSCSNYATNLFLRLPFLNFLNFWYSVKITKMSQLPADCLNEIFEYLEEDVVTLRSCLLVNRLWCEVSVGFLWRNIRNYNTLIACLPNESKEILYKGGINTS